MFERYGCGPLAEELYDIETMGCLPFWARRRLLRCQGQCAQMRTCSWKTIGNSSKQAQVQKVPPVEDAVGVKRGPPRPAQGIFSKKKKNTEHGSREYITFLLVKFMLRAALPADTLLLEALLNPVPRRNLGYRMVSSQQRTLFPN